MEVITGQQTAAGYLQMQKTLGGFYSRNFFEALSGQNPGDRFLEIRPGSAFRRRRSSRSSHRRI